MSYQTLFLQQSYRDCTKQYEEILHNPNLPLWDYVVLTASNEAQAQAYRAQISYRLKHQMLPEKTHYAVLPDPDGKRVGSGGATLNVLRYIREHAAGKQSPAAVLHGAVQGDGAAESRQLASAQPGEAACHAFDGKRILVIHSGGDSKRVPQYSACGKLFSPVPRILPNGRRSTLFDEFMIAMCGVAARMNAGMLVCSGDVLLLFNPLQIDFYGKGAAALSIKEPAEIGKNHGVYRRDREGNVGGFLHKKTVEQLHEMGAVDEHGHVDIDTGAVMMSVDLLNSLYSLIDTEEKFAACVNEQARLSFYADFLYPLASDSTLEQYYQETPEGEFTPELRACREKIWAALHPYQMKLIRMSPAAFIHFGTTRELLHLMTEGMEQFTHLGWQARINTNSQEKSYGAGNSYISLRADVGAGSYIEDSYLHHGTVVGERCVISGVTLDGQSVPADTVLHGLKLQDGRFVVRMYGVCDNPKEAALFGKRSANRCGRQQFIRFEIRFRKQYLRHCVHMKTVFQH
ncbi:MAG: L-fucokinase [Gallintestinimicrobium sp.]